MNSQRWLAYFQNNRLNRVEPQWHLPCPDEVPMRKKLARSLSHFELGESGEGRFLLKQARQYAEAANDPAYFEALALFIQEEQEHGRLLRELVKRFDGNLTHRHWTHSVFRLLRRAFGLDFEIQVLVIAELVGTAYYRLLHLRGRDPALDQACALVLRDEAKHIEFHCDRLAMLHRELLPCERALWCWQFQALFLGAARAAWLDHAECLLALGATRHEFLREARKECIAFLRKLCSADQPIGIPAPHRECAEEAGAL
ncbi:MAG: hypothetical protein QOD99_1126 [Chthoniobacter sp.]|jgi:hypothetical protein|nr:hypothetical protein [Chthoniobacter sp.]